MARKKIVIKSVKQRDFEKSISSAANPGISFGNFLNIKKRLPAADSTRVVTKTGPDAEVHLRVPLRVTNETGFKKTRQKARNIIDVLKKDGSTKRGLEDLLAALVYEVVDQEYYGK